MQNFSRREMLTGMGCLVAGAAIATPKISFSKSQFPQSVEWKAHTVDVTIGQQYAYDAFHKGHGCCYGSFYSIVGQHADKFGSPYKDFPFHMMKMGKSGVAGWGTICGALLGAALAFSLYYDKKEHKEMATELFRWYEQETFPQYIPAQSHVNVDKNFPTSVSPSILCHVSASRWAYVSGFPVSSPQRSERCGRLTADVSRKAIELFNAKIDGTFVSTLPTQSTNKHCNTCHDSNGDEPYAKGKQNCGSCHSGTDPVQNKLVDHP